MKKGTVVVAKAYVFGSQGQSTCERLTDYNGLKGRYRNLFRNVLEKPIPGIVVGYSFRQAGPVNEWSNPEDSYTTPYLSVKTNQKVYMVQPLNTERWVKPYPCLEKDLVVVDFTLWVEDGMINWQDAYTQPEGLMDSVMEGDDFRCIVEEEHAYTLEDQEHTYLLYVSGSPEFDEVWEDGYPAGYTEVNMYGEVIAVRRF